MGDLVEQVILFLAKMHRRKIYDPHKSAVCELCVVNKHMNHLHFNTHPFLTFTSLSFDPLFFPPVLSNVVAEAMGFHVLSPAILI